MQFDRFNCDDVFFIYLNLLYLQIKNSVLTFHFFKIIKENEKKSNWIVVSKMGFPQDYKTRLYVFTTINVVDLEILFYFFIFIKEILCFPCIFFSFSCIFHFPKKVKCKCSRFTTVNT